MPPDFETLEPVLTVRQGLPGCSAQLQSGQKTKWQLGEEHTALRGLRDEGLGLEQIGHLESESPSFNLLASSTNSLCRTLEGDTKVALDRVLSLLAAVGETLNLVLATSSITLLGEVLLVRSWESTPTFSLSGFIFEMRANLLSL